MPAIVDHAPKDGGKPISVFESGAILTYLGEKTGKFLSSDVRGEIRHPAVAVLGRMGGLGPMADRTIISRSTRRRNCPNASTVMSTRPNRLYGVLNKRLADREFLAGDYSVADMASYPWVVRTSGRARSWKISRI